MFSSKLFFMSKIRRERCPQCGSMDVIKWGTRGGRKRFKCKNCDSMFTYRRKDVSKSNRFTWFRWWIVGKPTETNDVADIKIFRRDNLSVKDFRFDLFLFS